MKRFLLAAGGAAVLTIGALGVSYAQTTPDQARAHPLAHVRRDELQVAARTLGLPDVKSLRAELAGSTLTAVAQKHNVAASTVSSAIEVDLTARVQAAVVKPKRLEKLIQRIPTRVSKLMAHQFKPKAA